LPNFSFKKAPISHPEIPIVHPRPKHTVNLPKSLLRKLENPWFD